MRSDRRALEHGGRLRALRALAARGVRGHPSGGAGGRRPVADEPVLRVVDLGAADGVNSHGLIRALARQRAGRRLVYALVDLPTNAWGVARRTRAARWATRPTDPGSL